MKTHPHTQKKTHKATEITFFFFWINFVSDQPLQYSRILFPQIIHIQHHPTSHPSSSCSFFLDRFPFLLFVFESTIKHRELSLRMLFLFFLFFFVSDSGVRSAPISIACQIFPLIQPQKKREQKIPLSRRMKIFKETSDPEQKKKELLSFFLSSRKSRCSMVVPPLQNKNSS